MVDAARLGDELRAEQDTAMALERDKKLLESQVLISFDTTSLYICLIR